MRIKNLLVYRLASAIRIKANDLEDKLKAHALQPCGSFEMESRGWIAPRSEDRYLHHLEHQWLIMFGVNARPSLLKSRSTR